MTRRLRAACVRARVADRLRALHAIPRIADLKYNPGRYQNHTVTLDGVVTTIVGRPDGAR